MNIPVPLYKRTVRVNLFKVAILLITVIFLFSAVAITVTSQSGFCNSCHIMDLAYSSWQDSGHHDVSCLSCHIQPGFASYMKGKVGGLSQALDCAVGRIGTKPSATVLDISCLRSACHDTDELLEQEIDYDGIKFTHKGHINETIDGIEVSCATCHSHYQGEEHFSVDKQVCFTCHFLQADSSEEKLVPTQCLDCHDVPDKEIDRGMVKVNHQEFSSYVANCEDSCHSRQINIVSEVSETTCLNCHSFGIDPEVTSEELHHHHSIGEKVECFACHTTVTHGPLETSSVASMISCENCHSDTHSAQQTIFSAAEHPTGDDNSRILSPMFLTHVECTDCHIERSQADSAILDSIGTVATAVPQACDRCHESGTGDKYVPFWQSRIKKLYDQVSQRLADVEASSDAADIEVSSELYQRNVKRAHEILDSVKADGSWGVHNLKYTEAMLLQANKLITEIR